jgi:hypothetical protein
MPRLPSPARAALWNQRFERMQQSGLTVEQFCKQEAIGVSSFYHWKKKLTVPIEQPSASLVPAPKFVAVHVLQSTPPRHAILRLPAGVCIDLPLALSTDMATGLIAACIQAAAVTAKAGIS